MFSAVISEHYSKNRVIISVVAAKIWYLKNVQFLLGHPVQCESKKSPLRLSEYFSISHKRLRIFNRFFTHLLYVPMYAKLEFSIIIMFNYLQLIRSYAILSATT